MNSINYILFVVCFSFAVGLTNGTYNVIVGPTYQTDFDILFFFLYPFTFIMWIFVYMMYRQIKHSKINTYGHSKNLQSIAFYGMKKWQIAVALALAAVVISYFINA